MFANQNSFVTVVALLGCFITQGLSQWTSPPPAADPACPIPTCQTANQLELLFPQPDPNFFWQCGGNGVTLEAVSLPCPPFTLFTYVTQACEFIESFIPTCTATPNPPNVNTGVPTEPTQPTTLSTTATPITTLSTTPSTSPSTPTTSLEFTTLPPSNCPCPCPCFPWFPCQPCRANCSCQG